MEINVGKKNYAEICLKLQLNFKLEIENFIGKKKIAIIYGKRELSDYNRIENKSKNLINSNNMDNSKPFQYLPSTNTISFLNFLLLDRKYTSTIFGKYQNRFIFIIRIHPIKTNLIQ